MEKCTHAKTGWNATSSFLVSREVNGVEKREILQARSRRETLNQVWKKAAIGEGKAPKKSEHWSTSFGKAL